MCSSQGLSLASLLSEASVIRTRPHPQWLLCPLAAHPSPALAPVAPPGTCQSGTLQAVEVLEVEANQ